MPARINNYTKHWHTGGVAFAPLSYYSLPFATAALHRRRRRAYYIYVLYPLLCTDGV